MRIFPKWFPRPIPFWFRKFWCVVKGFHSEPIIVIAENTPLTIACGCCGRMRLKVYRMEDRACPHRWKDDPYIDIPCIECELEENEQG